jgi:integrase
MAKLTPKLTQRKCETIRPKKVVREHRCGVVPGLNLAVQVSGTKSWFLRYRHDGRTRKLRLGSFPEISLAAARKQAEEALALVKTGIDPAAPATAPEPPAPKPVAKDADLIPNIAHKYLELHVHGVVKGVPKLRKNSRIAAEKYLTMIVDAFPNTQLSRLERLEVHEKLIDPLLAKGHGTTANRLLSTLSGLVTFALQRGSIKTNPIAGLKRPTAEVSRDRCLSNDELKMVLEASKAVGFPFGVIIELLVLTGQRRLEIAEMSWSELDLDKSIWVIPAARSKNKKQHTLPLAPQVIAILSAIPRGESPFVFASSVGKPFSAFAKATDKLRSLLPPTMPHWQLHDLRRSFASGCAELQLPMSVVELCLNHRSGNSEGNNPIARVYNKYKYADEKVKVMEIWANHVDGLRTAK